MRNDDDLARARRERPVVDFTREVLSIRTKKIVKRVKKLEQLNAQRRHKLRIAIKKLRYATEFFTSLYTGKPAKRYRKDFCRALKVLQDALGNLNDITVHQRLAESVVHGPSGNSEKSREVAFAIGLVAGQEQSNVRRLIADAIDAGKHLGKSPRFWIASTSE